MKLNQFDLARQHELLRQPLEDAWRRVVSSNRFVLGGEVQAFESELAAYLGGGYVVGVSSGSDALLLALQLMGVRENDEVVLPSYTFCAPLEAVLRLGATPVFVDCAAQGFNGDPTQMASALSERTRAVIVVHLFGAPMDLSEIGPICKARGIALIEDAAQSLGAHTRDGKVGTLGDAGCFSFYPTKNLGALGDAGAIWVAEESHSLRLRRLRNHGHDEARTIRESGGNHRLDELQAAMLRVKLPYLDQWTSARRGVAARYRHLLRDSGISIPNDEQQMHTYNQFVILHPERDRIRAHLSAQDVETRVFYECPLHLHPSVKVRRSLPRAEQRSREALALPIYPEIEMPSVTRVAELLKSSVRER